MSGRVGSITTGIIADGLVFNMDAANRASYPRTGTTVTDTINNLSVILTNGPEFQSSGNGSINFDGVSDIGLINHNSALTSNINTMSVSMWINIGSIGSKFALFITNRNAQDQRTTFTMGIDNRQLVRSWNPSGNDTMVTWVGVGNGTTFYHAHEKELFGTTNGDNQWHNIIGTFNSNANELKLILTIIRDSNFMGNQIEVIYNLTWKIQQALNLLTKNKTTVVIAHRLSTILNSDQIYVIDSGKVIANGNHTELLKHSPVYKNFYDKQITKN